MFSTPLGVSHDPQRVTRDPWDSVATECTRPSAIKAALMGYIEYLRGAGVTWNRRCPWGASDLRKPSQSTYQWAGFPSRRSGGRVHVRPRRGATLLRQVESLTLRQLLHLNDASQVETVGLQSRSEQTHCLEHQLGPLQVRGRQTGGAGGSTLEGQVGQPGDAPGARQPARFCLSGFAHFGQMVTVQPTSLVPSREICSAPSFSMR
jgi:hypothetical protein